VREFVDKGVKIEDVLGEINDIDRSEYSVKEKFILLSNLLIENINQYLNTEKKFFPNTYAKLIHIYETIDFPIDYQKSLNRLYFYIKKEEKPKENYFQTYKFIIFELLNQIYKEKQSQENSEIEIVTKAKKNINLFGTDKIKQKEITNSFKVIFVKWNNDSSFLTNDKSMEEYQFVLSDKDQFTHPLFKPGANLNIINFELNEDKKYYSTHNSIIVYEPDILVSVTDIASCFNSNHIIPSLYIINKLTPFESGYKLILGNLVNSVFDELIIGEEKNFDEIFKKSLRQKILSLFSLSINDVNSAKGIKSELFHHFEQLKDIIADLDLQNPSIESSIEPSFISIEHGLQGRLDLLIEYINDSNKKEIIELKSGSAPNLKMFIREGGKSYQTGIWYNNIAQANAYNLLLDANYENRKGDSSLLYSKASNMPLRNVVNIPTTKRQIINTRNEIVEIEKNLADGDLSVINKIYKIDANMPDFMIRKISNIKSMINKLDDIKKKYFATFLSFQFREILSTKVGAYANNSDKGFSSIWNDEALSKFIYVKNINIDLSNFEKMYLYLDIDLKANHNFRVGDMIIFCEDSNSKNYFNGQLFKGVIKQVNKSFMIISLRNKLLNFDLFKSNKAWRVFQDSSDSLLYSNIPFILPFLNSELSEYIIGDKKPMFEQKKYYSPELDEYQNSIVEKAISLKNYYLIVGPPGTGKTSYILKSIAEYFYSQTDQTILIAAFTNRAVDEICSALKRSEKNIQMLRLGSKESSIHSDILISSLSQTNELKTIRKRLERTKVIVSTISSLIKNTEIFEIKKFDTLIIDEASQIPELDSIAVISKVEKFIMIGDDKQLPAIFSQKDEYFEIYEKVLNDSGFEDLSQSLFSRLKAKTNKLQCQYAVGKLKKQARMQSDIMKISNLLFYNNELQLFDTKLQEETFKLSKNTNNYLEEIIQNNRIIFIDTPISRINKLNEIEAQLCKDITDYLLSNYSNQSGDLLNDKIGIISPFRIQCTELRNLISNNNITIDTVERYQGSERDHIIISLSTNTTKLLNNIQSLAKIDGKIIDRKLNVAISRAKQQLIILGNKEVLKNSPIYSDLIDLISEIGIVVDYEDLL